MIAIGVVTVVAVVISSYRWFKSLTIFLGDNSAVTVLMIMMVTIEKKSW